MTLLVLLATHNGERFLDEQLKSIFAQTIENWYMLLRDDGSSDQTQSILANAARNDNRLEILPSSLIPQGPVSNFGFLLAEAAKREVDWIALSDQDDYWLASKLESQLNMMISLEKKYGRSTPLLVHSDLEVVGPGRQVISPSFMKFQWITNPHQPTPTTLLVQNHVVGCTILINRSLLELAIPVPKQVYMHDWWLALCANFAGHINYIPSPLVHYRQHQTNLVGVHGIRQRLLKVASWPEWLRKMNRIYQWSFDQAWMLRERLAERSEYNSFAPTSFEYRRQLDRFMEIREMTRCRRPLRLLLDGIQRQNPVMTALLYFQSVFYFNTKG